MPYKGNPSAINEVVAGMLPFMFNMVTQSVPLIKAGKVKALAVTTLKRSPLLPNLPTMVELGFPKFESVSWHAIFAPKGTPKSVIERLNAEIGAALRTPEVRDKLASHVGLEPLLGTPADLTAQILREIPRWAALVKHTGAQTN